MIVCSHKEQIFLEFSQEFAIQRNDLETVWPPHTSQAWNEQISRKLHKLVKSRHTWRSIRVCFSVDNPGKMAKKRD